MFCPDVPEYTIDLRLPEAERWREVIAHTHGPAHRLAHEASAEIKRIPEIGRWGFDKLYESYGGLYHQEIAAWADALDLSVGTATLLNCSYELSHVNWKHTAAKILGCTAGVKWIDGLGLVHLRNLDWPFENLGNATCLFQFVSGHHEFVSVGIAGFVGIFSGMVPGGYSATINWAPPIAQPDFAYGPVFLLRQVLEDCDNYVDAVQQLTDTPLSTSVFFTICGTEKNQACIIERTQTKSVVREMVGSVLVQANHHVAVQFVNNNMELLDLDDDTEESSYAYSQRRADALECKLNSFNEECSLETIAALLDVEPTCNESTYQQMAFCPRTGEIRAWRRLVK